MTIKQRITMALLAIIGISLRLIAAPELVSTNITELNLKAKVFSETVTNVVTGNNQRGCGTCEMLRTAALSGAVPAINHPWHNAEPWRAADEMWTITNVVARTTLSVFWGTNTLTHVEDVPMWSTTNRYKLRAEWKAE